MSGTQHLRLFLQERLTLAAEEIFGVVEKSISEYEEQVVQSKREVEQLKQHILTLTTVQPHIHLDTIDSQPVSEELLPLQQLNPRQELLSSREDEAVQHQSPQVKEEQVDLSIIPHSETSIYNIVTNGFVTSESTSDSQLIPPHTTSTVAVKHSTDAKEERMDLSIVPDSETCSSNIVANGLVKSESTIDSLLIPSYTTVTAQHSTQVKEEQADISIIPGSETSISISGINGFVTSESASDSQLIPSHGTETAITSHDVANDCYESEGPGLAFSQSADVYCIVQKICCFCRKQFHSYAELMKHVEESHTGHKAFKCPECDKEFACRDTWADHCRIHTGVKPHSCPFCGKLFTLHSCLEVHMRTHTDSQPVSEELLPLQQLNPRQDLMSSQEAEAVQHQSPQVKEEQVDLSIIPDFETSNSGTNGFVESQTASDSQQIPSYTNETVQHCPQVKEELVDFSIIPDFETSIYNSGTNAFVTSEIPRDSQLMASYTAETAITNGDDANKCNESEGSGLTFSQRDVDMYSMEQKICRFCRHQCRSYSDLVKHVEESHIGQRAFKCPVCDKEFARRDKFSIHYRIHSGVKPHSCPVCGKSFTQRSNCIIHMRTHTGVKPHSCPVCRKLFAQSSNLNLHMRTHSGVRPHLCPHCGKTFTDSSALKVHVRIHTGVRPYSCHVCGKVFNQNSNLKVHMRTHTGRGAGEGEEVWEQY